MITGQELSRLKYKVFKGIFLGNNDSTVITLLKVKSLFSKDFWLTARKIINDFRRGRLNIKTLSNAYLFVRYGVRLSFKALTRSFELMSELEVPPTNYFGAHSVSTSVDLPQNLYVESLQHDVRFSVATTSLNRLITETARKGLSIAYGHQLWDAVPYSFVIDWLTNLSSMLEWTDVHYISEFHSINMTCESHLVKIELRPITCENYRITGSPIAKSYTRYISNTLDISSFDDWGPSIKFSNILDGTALAFQRLKL